MKIWFVRHGEAMDDIRDEYGGWHDPELSEKGITQAKEVAKKLIEGGVGVKVVLSSPLLRARQTAEMVAEEMGVKMETVVYLKERNTYGLLCGINKTEAVEKYPELVKAYEAGEPVAGYEDYASFVTRVKDLVGYLQMLDMDAVAVTHGKLLAALLTEQLGKKPSKLGDNCIVEVELVEGKLTLIETTGVEF